MAITKNGKDYYGVAGHDDIVMFKNGDDLQSLSTTAGKNAFKQELLSTFFSFKNLSILRFFVGYIFISLYILIYTQKQQKTIGSQRFFYPEKLNGLRCLVRALIRCAWYRCSPPTVPPSKPGGTESDGVNTSRESDAARFVTDVLKVCT